MSNDIAARLKAPFDPARVSWRVGSTTQAKDKGLALAYIDARDVMERLDEVCGIAGWQKTYPHANGKTVCNISIKIDDEWITKADGAGDTDVEAEKGALSDAFKRAAVSWGVGRYLYDIPTIWVALEQRGRSYIIKEGEYPRLAALLGKNAPTVLLSPQEPSPDPDAAEASNHLIDLLKKCASADELAELKGSAGFSGILNSLPEIHYKLVAAVYTKMKAELAPKAA